MKRTIHQTHPHCWIARQGKKASGWLAAMALLLGSFATQAQTVVQTHGLLRTEGSKIVNAEGEQVSFAGNSFFWSNDNWGGEKYYDPAVVRWLKIDWNTTIVRAAMGVEDDGGYLTNPEGNKAKLKVIVDAAIANGLYVIIDWHSHHAEDHPDEAVAFFEEMATTYGEYDNVIYEIYNEPLAVSWSHVIKPYAETVIDAIRAIDPDNMIIVGSPEWSQKVDDVAADPITGYDNIAYTLHFYSVWHHQWLRDRASAALNSGIPLFATEWGALGDTMNDAETAAWMQWCEDNHISHCNWSINDKVEPWSALRPGASTTGGWHAGLLTISGTLVKGYISEWPTYREDDDDDVTGLFGPSATQASVHPNPAIDYLLVQGLTAQDTHVSIVGTDGRERLSTALQFNHRAGSARLNVSALEPGVYFARLQGGAQPQVFRFVKQ